MYLEAVHVVTPARDDLLASPMPLFASIVEVTSPQGSIALIHTNDVFDAVKRTPGHPGCLLRDELAQG